ncbi:MAG: NapC/NirT family cytochrome c [Planctomycetota bacterium]
MKYIKKIIAMAINIFMELKLSVKILLVFVLIALFSIISIELTSQPGFCNSCHIMNPYYDNWKVSSHSEVSCINCHLQPGLAGLIKGKINGFAQSIDCLVGRIGTKPNATVTDDSCLRTGCHDIDELELKNILYKSVKFTHKGHMSKVVDGINVSCGTCHNHFEGDEHFTVNENVCFTCHFLESKQNSNKPVQIKCLDCHEVPDKIIDRGLVRVNHLEFISYKTSCEDSCHKRQIERKSQVAESICLNCHSFKKTHESSEQLHEEHTVGEKVECFTCHGKVSHGSDRSSSLAAMIDCKSCHSDTHSAQLGIYTTRQHPQQSGDKRIISPMFLTHVECTGCHIEPIPKKSGILDSFGTVARAVPEACDKCHEDGAGQRYTSFWQKETRKLHKQVSDMVDKFERRIKFETDKEQTLKINARVTEARAILESVSSDGSWGVHNFKYTETMLLRAKDLVK